MRQLSSIGARMLTEMEPKQLESPIEELMLVREVKDIIEALTGA